MNRKITSAFFVAALLLLGRAPAVAEDIDIFSSNTTITTGAPNVLIVMDNTANWSQSFSSGTKFSAEKVALAAVVDALKTQFNLGLMMFSETGGANTNVEGGYVRFAIQPMTDSSGGPTDARNCLLKMVGAGTNCTGTGTTFYTNLHVSNDRGSKGLAGIALSEAYDYFAGLNAYAGHNKEKADPLAFTSGSNAGPTYKSPIAANSCQKNFIIIISNGPFQDDQNNTPTATSQLAAAGGNTAVINPPDNGTSQNNVGDEWVRFLNKVDTVNAVTYTLEVGPSTTGQGPYNTRLLQSMGRQGKGGYYSAIDAATLLAALTRIFNDIQAINSVFASASLPLSADNSGAYSDQIYMGVFRPDGGGNPRWVGNLKQYKFAADANGALTVVDSANQPAAGTNGFATPDGISFWTSIDTSTGPDAAVTPATSATNGSTGGFWYFDSKGSGGSYDLQDGEWVEKGGAAQQLRLAYLGYANRGGIGDLNSSTLNSSPARKLYTCTGSCLTTGTALSTTPFDSSNSDITDAALGTGSATISSLSVASAKSVTALSAGVSVAITAATKSGGTQVITTAGHSFVVGNSVIIAGSTNQFDGTYTLTAVTSTTMTMSNNGTSSTGAGGTATVANTTATATSTAHALSVGQKITMTGATPTTFNGSFTVASVPSANSFTYTLAAASGSTATGTILAYPNIATATTSAAHNFTTGQSVTVAGVTPTAYNGVFVVTVTGGSTFTYNFPSTTAVTAAGSGGSMSASIGGGRATLIRWVRGQDTQDENGFKVAGADTDVRASIHGDVLHSRPVVINYGTPATGDDPFIFYGGNDGVFRAIKGGQLATDGKERWGFIPSEFFGKLKRIYDNSPAVLYPSTTGTITPTPIKRDYFWDGQTGTYISRNVSTGVIEKAVLFITMRRGGRYIYALDVTAKDNPIFLWKKGCPNAYPNNTGCDTGFAEIGQTWSTPVAVKVHANTNPVVIFGAGYDATSEDTEPPATTDVVGRAIYVLDAFTGAPLFTVGHATGAAVSMTAPANMNFSFPSDVLAMDRNQTGFVDRVYAPDVGGNVWRIDTSNSDMNLWTTTRLAAVGNRGAVSSTRKFFFGPDVVVGAAGTFDAVLIATGDREHPLASTNTNSAHFVSNRVYMLKDTNTGLTGTDLNILDPDVGTCSSNCLFDATNSAAVPTSSSGWYVTLATGEKAVNGPIVVSGEVIFGTNTPDTANTTCTGNLGIAKRYDISFENGAPAGYTDSSGAPIRSETVDGGGFLPSPIAGVVQIGGLNYPFIIDNPLAKPAPPTPTFDVPVRRFRTHWREVLE